MKTRVDVRKRIASACVAALVLAATASLLSACNTAAGFGEDMKAAGGAISNSAQQTKDKL
jgi:predicted small secreted protein